MRLAVVPSGAPTPPGTQDLRTPADGEIDSRSAAPRLWGLTHVNDRNSAPLARRRFLDIVPLLIDDAYTLAKWLCRDATDAEDIVQQASLRALKALETTSVDRPKPWFLAIVRNAALTWMARNRRSKLAYAGDMDDLDAIDPGAGWGDGASNPEAALIALEDGERLRQAIAELPPPLRETLIMRDVNGLSYREIAEATGAPMGTVMSRLARARAALVKTLRAKQ